METPICLRKLNERKKFPKKDNVYVLTSLTTKDKIIITTDHHFLHNGRKCLNSLNIKIVDEREFLESDGANLR